MEKIHIEGIKLSTALISTVLHIYPKKSDSMSRILQSISDQQINLVYLSCADQADMLKLTFCVDIKDHMPVRNCLENVMELYDDAEYFWPVGLLSIFNHNFSLKILSRIMDVFCENHIHFYGSASSLSSLYFIIHYDRANEAVAAIQRNIEVCADQIYVSF